MEEGGIVVKSTGGSSRPKNKKIKTDIDSCYVVPPPRPVPYDVLVLIRMPFYDGAVSDFNIERWYTMTIPEEAVDGSVGLISDELISEKLIFEVWRHPALVLESSFALLGSDLYCLGGQLVDGEPSILADVSKLDIRKPTDGWTAQRSMISPRIRPHTVVLGGKLYVFSGDNFSRSRAHRAARGGEVYDPMTGSWQPLPDPPCGMGHHVISAALENPNRILVAWLPKEEEDDEDEDEHHDDDDDEPNSSKKKKDDDDEPCLFDRYFANFYMYDVQNCSWEMLAPVRREIHSQCPLGIRGKAVAVGDYLYWITDLACLLAYNFHLDLWLTADLSDMKISFVKYYESALPTFFHLENQRFCVIQRAFDRHPSNRYVQCVIFDVSPMPEKMELGISIVSFIKCNTPQTTFVVDGFLM